MVPEERERRGLLPRFTLKDDNSFLLADSLGDIQGSDDGLYRDDTRMLSRYEFEIAGRHPSLLGASINQQNTLFTAHLTNRPLPALGEQSIPEGVIHIERRRFLYESRLYEEVRFTNYSNQDYASVPSNSFLRRTLRTSSRCRAAFVQRGGSYLIRQLRIRRSAYGIVVATISSVVHALRFQLSPVR